ncbi:MAG: pyridoxal-dependent decarboxylase [Gemmatimonadota bacterium]|nr:pyridoxal-dependent decarboxylase [Gemmatimonadota bacterium]
MRTRAKHPDPTSRRSRILQLEQAARPLDPDAAERNSLMRAAHAYAQHFLDKLPETPAYNHDKSGALELRDLAAGPGPRPVDQLIERIDESVVRPGLKPSHAGHLAYIPGGGIYASSLADYLAAVTNEYAGVRFAGPGAVEMEDLILDWMAKLVGFPETADGNLASGGSVASLIAVVAAREAAGLRARDFHRAVVYASPHIHQCLHKALRVAGLGESVRRDVAVDEGRRLCPESLSEAIAADRARGLRPWLVLASAGTADTGALDPLATIADIARREGLWYHVDAAYGGFFAMLPEFRPVLSGMERADSIVLDPHKGMFLPYGTGAVLVRNRDALQDAHAYYAAYMQDTVEAEAGGRSPAAVSPELTKHFRGLRVWLPLLLHGEEPFRACLREKVELAKYFHREAGKLGFEVGPEPDLTVVTFRWVPESGGANAFNQALVEETHRDGRVFMSSTTVEGEFMLRMAALAFRTHLDTIDLALEVLRQALARLGVHPGPLRSAVAAGGRGR